MPRATTTMLDSGDRFPGLKLDRLGGGEIHLPDEFAGRWGALLFYRGHW